MAPERVYRNYTLDEDTYDARPQRKSFVKQAPLSNPATTSERTLRSDNTPSDGQLSSVGLTTDDDGVTPYEDDVDLDIPDPGVPFHPLTGAGATALSPVPADFKTQGSNGISRPADSQRKASGRDGFSPPTSPAPRATTRPSYRSNYVAEEPRQAQAVASQDGTQAEIAAPGDMPDFFSPAVFQVVLRNPAIAHQLLKFGQTRLCGEHMEFLAKVNKYHLLLHEVSRSISGLYEEFFADGAPKYVNVPQVSYGCSISDTFIARVALKERVGFIRNIETLTNCLDVALGSQ